MGKARSLGSLGAGGKLIKIWPSESTVYRPLQDAFSNDDEVAQLVNSLTEDGAHAVSQLSMPATAVM